MSANEPNSGQHHPIDVGDTLGQYKLVELIAVGGMGIVYRAYEKSLDRYVAVKVLSHELAKDPEIAKRFLDEARASATLNHPNVVHVYSAGEQAGTFYFVMELVVGEHMEALLARHEEISVQEATEYVRQAALGLKHAHEHGIIHGDVKPANFIVSESGVVKVTDFGLARRLKASTSKMDGGSVFGTPAYVSPDVIQGQMPDHRSDIYSLGATLFHMLAGKPPYTGSTAESTMRRHLENPVPSLQQANPKVTPALNQIVTRMLAKDPAARYQSYSDLLHAMERCLAALQPTGAKAGPAGKRLGGGAGAVRGLGKDPVAARPAGLAGGGSGTPAPGAGKPAAEPPKHRKRDVILSFVFTLISVVACGVILYIIYHNGQGRRLMNPLIVITNPAAVSPAQPVVNVEQEAKTQFEAYKAQAEKASGEGRFGSAYAVYNDWPVTRYADTTSGRAVADEKSRWQAAARQHWDETYPPIKQLLGENNFDAASTLADRLARSSEGVPELDKKITEMRNLIAKTKQDHDDQIAQEAAAAEKARQAKLDQWKAQFDGYVLGFQWDKGQQEAHRLAGETGNDAALTAAINGYQTEMDKLVALRNGVAERVKDKPSAELTVTTKLGEMKAQVTEVAPERIVLRRSLDAAGFAETPVAWNEFTPASVSRLLMSCLDQSKPDEVLGYAVLIAHQALGRQARVDDARQTLQAVIQRNPDAAPFLNRFLDQFAGLDKQARQVETARRFETEAQALWVAMQADASQNQWTKLRDEFPKLTVDYGGTDFVKSHADDIEKLNKTVALHTAPKGYAPLDISAAYNATFIARHMGKKQERGFLRSSQFATEEVAHHKKDTTQGLPDDGRIPVPDSNPPGFFQLRTGGNDRKDAIGLTSADGQYPQEVTVKLLPSQQLKYANVALLFASSVGHATFKVSFNYDNQDQGITKIKVTNWNETNLGRDRDETVAATGSDSQNGRETHMFSQNVQMDATHKLLSITLTWVSASTENPDHCIGIFAISGSPAQ